MFRRKALAITCLLMTLALIGSAFGQGKAEPVYLRVLLPDKDAELLIDGKETKHEGATRIFVTPPLPPGKKFTYKLEALWGKDKYTDVLRTRVVEVQAGKVIEVDMREADPKNPDMLQVSYPEIPEEVVEAMCKLANVGKDDVVYDLGCGDGRIVITAVSKFKAKKGVGIDGDGDVIKSATDLAKKAKLNDKITFRKQDPQTLKDLGDATVVMLYVGEESTLALVPLLKKSLKSGARIVSHDFKMGDWKADKMQKVTDDDEDDHMLYLWTIKK